MTEPVLLKERAQTALDLGESHFREFKSGLEGPPAKKTNRSIRAIRTDVAETLVAFANADGGELLVGVEDNGEVTGLDTFSPDELSAIERAHEDRIHRHTPLRSVRVARIKLNDTITIYFFIPKGQEFVHLTSDGKCLQRKDLESVPISSEHINFDRNEIRSREYDRGFIEGPQPDALEMNLVRAVADQVSAGMSAEKCLQYLDLVEYTPFGFLLRRAALLLFAKNPIQWHPRLQVRIMKVDGTAVGTGTDYNVVSDEMITGNILELIERGWDALGPHLVQTRLGKGARFHATFMYPEYACREALVNAIAHRDYSQEGRGIEIYVFQDRMEVSNPGALLSTISIDDLINLEGVHQSRNSYIARVLRELGYMRELGEGVRRIFELMKSNELSPPELRNERETFTIILHHRPMYSGDELVWLDQFAPLELDREQKAIVVLGRRNKVIAPQDIWDSLGLVDTEHYRRLVASLQDLRILTSEVDRRKAAQIAKQKKIPARQVPRFRIVPPAAVGAAFESAERQRAGQKEGAGVAEARLSVSGSGYAGPDAGRIYVGNIPKNAQPKDLYEAFIEFGMIEAVDIPGDGRSNRGYGFVEFGARTSAQKAIEEMSGKELFGRILQVRWARPRIVPKPKRRVRRARSDGSATRQHSSD